MLTISAVVPVYNGRPFLSEGIPALSREIPDGFREVIVVDDCSSDGSGQLAEELGAQVVRLSCRAGPAAARNAGAKLARSEILFFVDADVIVRASTADELRAAFAAEDVTAVIGSYDDSPRCKRFLSQYKNLLHHHIHQSSGSEAYTFWAGCGAVRKKDFDAAGGFNARRFKEPSVEDIELGYRLRAAGGRIVVRRSLQCTHLKSWTLRELLYSDIFRRAIPWAELLIEKAGRPAVLNVSYAERARSLVAVLLFVALVLSLSGAIGLWVPLLLSCVALLSNLRLISRFQRSNGLRFALSALAFHQIYYLYSFAAYVWCYGKSLLPAKTTGDNQR